MRHLGVSAETIDISALAFEAFREMGHSPFGIDCRGLDVESFRAALARVPAESRCDLTFENVQARLRTLLLMSKGFVVARLQLLHPVQLLHELPNHGLPHRELSPQRTR